MEVGGDIMLIGMNSAYKHEFFDFATITFQNNPIGVRLWLKHSNNKRFGATEGYAVYDISIEDAQKYLGYTFKDSKAVLFKGKAVPNTAFYGHIHSEEKGFSHSSLADMPFESNVTLVTSASVTQNGNTKIVDYLTEEELSGKLFPEYLSSSDIRFKNLVRIISNALFVGNFVYSAKKDANGASRNVILDISLEAGLVITMKGIYMVEELIK